MSALPTGWAEVELGEVIESKETRNPRTDGSESFRYIDVQAVDNRRNRVNIAAEAPSRTAPSRARQLVRKDDVLFCLVRPYLRNIVRVPPELDGQVASTAFCVLRPSGVVASRFLFHQVLRDSFIGEVPTYGTSPPSAREDEFLKQRIPLAPLREQHRIVAKIESLFARLDEGVAALERAEANLERYRASVFKAAVEGRLTEQWRRENPPDETGEELLRRILAEQRKRWEAEKLAKFAAEGKKPPRNWKAKYREPVAPDASALPRLPEGWCWATVDQLAPVIQYGHTASADPSKQDGPRFLRITDIQDGRVQWSGVPGCVASEAETEKYRLSAGDIVFARTGATTGKSYLIESHPEAIFASYLIRVGLSYLVHPRYVSVFFQSGSYWSQVERGKRGIGQPNVNARVLANITLPLPPVREQVEIADRVAFAEDAVWQASSRFMGSCLTAASALRQSILKRAFEGRLVPQDPDDEPASVLLERIRAERQGERTRGKRRAAKPRRQRRNRVA